MTEAKVASRNWTVGRSFSNLEEIQSEGINVAIYSRDLSSLEQGIAYFIQQEWDFKSSGSVDSIVNELHSGPTADVTKPLFHDIEELLRQFASIAQAESYRLTLSVVGSNMCRKFHTDINDLRLLCTYSGQGTLWLTDDNVDRTKLSLPGAENTMVLDESRVQQADSGDVLILKGALFPSENSKAAVHRSPSIEEFGSKRLLLRIDTNDFLNF